MTSWCAARYLTALNSPAVGGRLTLPDYPGGLYFEPTVLVHRDDAAEILCTEVFGPVLSVMCFDEEDEVVERANGTPYGLAAGVWTSDLSRAHRMAKRLEAGTVWINMYRSFTAQSPMGGRKQSGIGVQNGIEAVYQYLATKSVCCDLDET